MTNEFLQIDAKSVCATYRLAKEEAIAMQQGGGLFCFIIDWIGKLHTIPSDVAA